MFGGMGAAAMGAAPTRERPSTHILHAPNDTYPEQRSVQSGPPIPEYDIDDLPGYEDASHHRSELPSYNQQLTHHDHTRTLSGEALVYSLRQLERRQQAFISMGPPMTVPLGPSSQSTTAGARDLSTSTEYRISHTNGAGFSKSKPDILIMAVDREKRLRRESYVPPATEKSTSKIRSLFSRGKDKDRDQETDRRHSVASVGSVASEDSDVPSQPIASIRFARSGPMPWTPRATVSYAPEYAYLCAGQLGQAGQAGQAVADSGLLTSDVSDYNNNNNVNNTLNMEMRLARSQNRGWICSVSGREYSWILGTGPSVLALVDLESGECRATFSYSEFGTGAGGGKEIGRLSVPLRSLSKSTTGGEKKAVAAGFASGGMDMGMGGSSSQAAGGSAEKRNVGLVEGFLEFALVSLSAAIQHWKNEGKILVNAVDRPRGFDEATSRKNAYGWGLENFAVGR